MERTDAPVVEARPAAGEPTNVLQRLISRIDGFQRRHRWVAVPFAVNKRFGEHDGTRLAATVSYYSFFSVFPLLLAFVTVLGFVLDDNPELRQDLLDGAIGQIPVIGDQLTAAQPLQGSVLALVIGLATAVWAGMGAAGALQQGLDDVGDVAMHRRPNFALKRVRVLLFLFAVAIGIGASVVLSSLTTLFDLGPLAGVLGIVATLVVNLGVVLAMYVVLATERRPVRQLLPGAIVAAVLLTALLQLGTLVVDRFITGAEDTYGAFAVVIALLAWFHLVSRVLLLSAQLNEVLAQSLWPRRLDGNAAMTDGDRRAVMLDVQRVQRARDVGYAVSVGGAVATDADPLADGSTTPT